MNRAMIRNTPLTVVAAWLALALPAFADAPTPLDARLSSEDPARVAAEARVAGDPARGALIFFRPSLQCAKCHEADLKTGAAPLGPDLAKIGRPQSDAHVVESILNPSKEIRQGFEPITVATHDGKTLVGLLAAERPDALLIRDPARRRGGGDRAQGH